ncbi:MAG: Trp biosynthesis-associated membrane protein [Aeromicrobium sp.]|uniref:Trp biosynthesis-associated membrane protein n=1 Tax=Aeromicrobium sp. TaxID=1871063 RepID=UPI0025C0230F|nr:Trp biosynthesis-associated membrane protein [Aeromicrobium sp.]MCK5890633.1 Trp biosynthesis-associated membrane protein [Aeromicrobium sp.]MDF1703398.1 Trp biosynthesis-associated membrane protein [Aeromicrobium sp.]
MAGSSPRRWFGPTVLGLVLAGGAAFVLGRRAWVTTTLGDGRGAGAVIETSGTDVSALVPGLAVVIVAAGLGVLAAGGWFRRLIGVLVVVASIGGIVATRTDPDGVVDAAVRESVAFGQGVEVSSSTHAGPWLAAAAFAVAVLLGLLVVRYGAAWPTMGSRYESPSARVVEPDGSDLWKAMDAGLDPTASDDDPGEDREADDGRPAR